MLTFDSINCNKLFMTSSHAITRTFHNSSFPSLFLGILHLITCHKRFYDYKRCVKGDLHLCNILWAICFNSLSSIILTSVYIFYNTKQCFCYFDSKTATHFIAFVLNSIDLVNERLWLAHNIIQDFLNQTVLI